MSWNYRVTKDEHEYAIREVYYKDEQIAAWSTNPAAPSGDTWDDLIKTIDYMQRAVYYPVIDITGGKPKELEASQAPPDYPTVPHDFIPGEMIRPSGLIRCARCRMAARGPGTLHPEETS